MAFLITGQVELGGERATGRGKEKGRYLESTAQPGTR